MGTNEDPPKTHANRAVTINIYLTRGNVFLMGLLALLLGGALLVFILTMVGATRAASYDISVQAAQAGQVQAPIAAATQTPTAAILPTETPTQAVPSQTAVIPTVAAAAELTATPWPTDEAIVLAETPLPAPVFDPVRSTVTPLLSLTPSPAEFIMQDAQSDLPAPAAANQAPGPGAGGAPAHTVAQAPVVAAPPANNHADAGAPPASPTPTPAPPPMDTIDSPVRWSIGQPHTIENNIHITKAGTLIIDPGVEVHLKTGVSIFVEGSLQANGAPGQSIKLIGIGGQRWGGIFGAPGSSVELTFIEIHNGGSGGTLIAMGDRPVDAVPLDIPTKLILSSAKISDNWGHIRVLDTVFNMTNSTVTGNTIPYGPAVQATFTENASPVITDNAVFANKIANRAAALRLVNQRAESELTFNVQHNLLVNQAGPDLEIVANGNIQGELKCNALLQGTNGLALHSEAAQDFTISLAIYDNAIEGHTPQIIPEYVDRGVGRGTTSEIGLNMSHNWWDNASGPYVPNRHSSGRGEAIGANVAFEPWLTQRPACAPMPQ